jgi:hypothetical protein
VVEGGGLENGSLSLVRSVFIRLACGKLGVLRDIRAHSAASMQPNVQRHGRRHVPQRLTRCASESLTPGHLPGQGQQQRAMGFIHPS